MDYSEKLREFPTINWISLHQNFDRQAYMNSQFFKYGLKSRLCLNKPYNSGLKEEITVIPNHFEEMIGGTQLGITISHIKLLREWYDNTNEPYAVFLEDDISLKSIDYWNFSWQDFFNRLPKDWRCVQLVRMENPCTVDTFNRMRLNLKVSFDYGVRWWSTNGLLRRDYVKEIVEQHNPEPNVYNLWHRDVVPISENIIYLRNDPVYNFPLFWENLDQANKSITKVTNEEEYNKGLSGRNLTQYIIEHLWRTASADLNLDEAMRR